MTPAARPFNAEQAAFLPSAVAEIGKIHFEGNIIPHSWYQRITLESGKPDMPAIILLAEILYWYRPIQSLDRSGKPISRKRFDPCEWVDPDAGESPAQSPARLLAGDPDLPELLALLDRMLVECQRMRVAGGAHLA